MRKFVIVASIIGLAASGASCGDSRESSNLANDMFPLTSLVSPSSLGDGPSPMTSVKGGNGNGKGKGNGGNNSNQSTANTASSLELVMVNDVNGDGLPNWGDTVTFNVSTSATSEPYVVLECYQNGSLVFSASAGYFEGAPFQYMQNMTLSSVAWAGDAASCTAELIYFSGSKDVVLAKLDFAVGA